LRCGSLRHPCAAVLQTQVPKLCTALDFSLLYILILGTYSKFARKNNFLALGVCFPQLCSSDCAAVLQTQVPKLCTALDLSLLYILILGTYSKFARKNNFLALGVCFPQPCSSAGRRFAATRSRVQKYRRIVSFPQQKPR